MPAVSAMTHDRQAAPAVWQTTSYTVRRPGCTAWSHGITTPTDARRQRDRANQIARGHVIYAEQDYVGDLPALRGTTRTVEVK